MPNLTVTNEAWQREVGNRLQLHRLNQNLSQTDLAEAIGIARKTITSVENGHGGTLLTIIAMLRGLNLLGHLEAFIPPPGPSPIQLVKLAGKQRKRATGKRGTATGRVNEPQKPWTWGPNA